jgi:hypothetical protein
MDDIYEFKKQYPGIQYGSVTLGNLSVIAGCKSGIHISVDDNTCIIKGTGHIICRYCNVDYTSWDNITITNNGVTNKVEIFSKKDNPASIFCAMLLGCMDTYRVPGIIVMAISVSIPLYYLAKKAIVQ